MIEKQTVCLRKLGGTRAAEVKLGRWLSNERVSMEELNFSVSKKTNSHVLGRHVLAIQDTTQLNYASKEGRINGLGPLGNATTTKGFFLHPMLVIDADSKACLGFSGIKCWVRDREIKGKAHGNIYKRQQVEMKESYRWIETAEEAKRNLSAAEMITYISDRESDIYEFWARIPDERTHLLIRMNQNRKTIEDESLKDAVNELEVIGSYRIEIKRNTKKRKPREAEVELRFGEIEVKRPVKTTDAEAPAFLSLRVVDVREKGTTPKGEKPIHWCLLTTHEIETVEDALEIVHWYAQRWHIEQLFRTLQKQGLDVESSQVENIESLMKLIMVACIAALQIMQLVLSRDKEDQSYTVVFDKQEKKLLSALQVNLEGKTIKQKNPHKVGTLTWAAWMIARLGGWKGYASESPPGPITMYDGFVRYQAIRVGWSLKDVCIE